MLFNGLFETLTAYTLKIGEGELEIKIRGVLLQISLLTHEALLWLWQGYLFIYRCIYMCIAYVSEIWPRCSAISFVVIPIFQNKINKSTMLKIFGLRHIIKTFFYTWARKGNLW